MDLFHLVVSPRAVGQNGFDAGCVKVIYREKKISDDAFSGDRGKSYAHLLVPMIPCLSNDRF